MSRFRLILFFCICLSSPLMLKAQQDSSSNQLLADTSRVVDSRIQVRNDSLKRLADSLSYFWIRPDSKRPNQFVDSLVKLYEVKNLDFQAWADRFIPRKNLEGIGKGRKQGDTWVMLAVLAIIMAFAVLRSVFRKDISLIMQAFYDSRLLNQAITGGGLLQTWPFVFLNVLFGLSVGMYLFLTGKYFDLDYAWDGWQWYLLLSMATMGLFILKIYVLRALGFLFEIQKPVRLYISILFLSYFHAAILFLPLIFAFSLSPAAYSGIFLYVGMALAAVIIIYQMVSLSTQLLSQYSFPKFYLFVYLCALEICPILILIKALRF